MPKSLKIPISILLSIGDGPKGFKTLITQLATLTNLFDMRIIACNNASQNDFSDGWRTLHKHGWNYFLSNRELSASEYQQWYLEKWTRYATAYNFFLRSGTVLPQHFFSCAIKTWGELPSKNRGALNLMGETPAPRVLPQPMATEEGAGNLNFCYMLSEAYLKSWPDVSNLTTYRVTQSLIDGAVKVSEKRKKNISVPSLDNSPVPAPITRRTRNSKVSGPNSFKRKKKAAFFVATTHRPQLLEVALKALCAQKVPSGWSYEVLVCGEPHDEGKHIAKKFPNVRYIVSGTRPPIGHSETDTLSEEKSTLQKNEASHQSVTSKLNTLLQVTGRTVDLVLLSDDDDIQPKGRLEAATKAYEEGFLWAGVGEVNFYSLRDDRMMRWSGQADNGLVGTSLSFSMELLKKIGGWPERARGKDGPMAAAVRRAYTGRPPFKDIGKEIDPIICLQHDRNIWSRTSLERGGKSSKGLFQIEGLGCLDEVEIPEDTKQTLRNLRQFFAPAPTKEELKVPPNPRRKPRNTPLRSSVNPIHTTQVKPSRNVLPQLSYPVPNATLVSPIDCSVILGTVNRKKMLQECIESVRKSLKDSGYTYEIIVAYGSESDESLTWMHEQDDIRPILGGMDGAIPAFNKAYKASKGRLVCQINDDVLIEGPSIANAIKYLDEDDTLGAVVFYMSRDNGQTYMEMNFPNQVPRLPHPNQVVARREVCEDIIAEGFGEFWGDEKARTHRTYGGDSAWGLRASRLGWKIERRPDVKLIDRVNETLEDPNRKVNSEDEEIKRHRRLWLRAYPTGYAQPEPRGELDWPNVYNPKRGMPYRRSPIEAGPPERVLHISLARKHEPQQDLCRALASMGPYQTIRWSERMSQVGSHQMYQEVFDLIRTHQPTLIWMQVQNGRAFTSDVIRQMKNLAPPECLIVSWTGDVRTDVDETVEPWMIDQCKELDLFLSSECTYAEKLREMNVRAKTGHMICGSDIIVNDPRPGNPQDWEAAGKACFVGSPHTGFHKGPGTAPRVKMAEDILQAFPEEFICYGHHWNRLPHIPSHPFITRVKRAELHSVARVVVIQSLFQKLRRYSSDRLNDSLYSKGFCAIQSFDDMEGYGLEDGVNCVVWKDNQELVEILKDWLRPERDKDRIRIQEAGHELAKKNWTWDSAVEQLLAIVREERRQRNIVLPMIDYSSQSASKAPIQTSNISSEKPLKLHIACGPKNIKGYLNTDLRPGPAVDQVLDAREPLPANTYSEIYACHVLEHFYVDETLEILKNWYQALREGGILRISVPDLRLIVSNCVESHTFGRDPNAPLFGDYRKNAQEPDRHKQAFVTENLTQFLVQAGFENIRPWKSVEVPEILAVKDWSSWHTISLNLLGVKKR